LTGVSDGGTYCYILGFANPTAFRALAPVAGVVPRTYRSKLLMMPKLPLCVVHGTKDSIFPVTGTREAVAAMKEAHLAVRYIEIADGKHGWFPDKAAEILDWFEKLRSP
jgi:phospholipase/carboxylesterase